MENRKKKDLAKEIALKDMEQEFQIENPQPEVPEEKGTITIVESKTPDPEEKVVPAEEEKKVPQVKILNATFGRGDKVVEVTKFLNDLPNGGNGRKIVRKLFGGQDPVPNKIKVLVVEFEISGVPGKREFMENEKLELI